MHDSYIRIQALGYVPESARERREFCADYGEDRQEAYQVSGFS
jgi:hypothetical protein